MKATAYGVGRFGADLVAESGEIGIGETKEGQDCSGTVETDKLAVIVSEQFQRARSGCLWFLC